jgi:cell division protease FtsH
MNFRNLAIWLVIVAVLGGVFVVSQNARTRNTGEVSYSQLLKEVDAGKIKSAEVAGQTVVAKTADNKVLTVNAPQNSDELVNRMVAKNADVKFKGSSISPWAILIQLLPILLVVACGCSSCARCRAGRRAPWASASPRLAC